MPIRMWGKGRGWQVGLDPTTKRPYLVDLELFANAGKVTVDTSEKGYAKSQFLSGMGGWDENPSDLVQQEGLEVLDEMLTGDAVKGGSKFLALAVISPGYAIQAPETDHPDAERVTALVEFDFDQIPGTFRAVEKGALSGRDKGYSLSELNYGLVKKGEFEGSWAHTSIKVKDPNNYRFKTDDFGNVEGMFQVENGPEIMDIDWEGPPPLKMEKWLHYAHDAGQVYGSPYGVSQLIPAHPYWKARRIVFKLRGMWVERYTHKNPVIKHPPLLNAAVVSRYEAIVKRVMAGTGVVVPNDVDLDFWGPEGSGHLEFQRFDDFCVRGIMRSILIPEQLGLGPESKVGARATAVVHQGLLDWVVTDMDTDLTTGMNEQVIPRLCGLNSDIDVFPKYVRKPRTLENALELVTMFVTAFEKGAVGVLRLEDVNQTRRYCQYPELTEKEWEERVKDGEPPLPEIPEEEPEEEEVEVPSGKTTVVVKKDVPGDEKKVEASFGEEGPRIDFYGRDWQDGASCMGEFAQGMYGRETPASIESGLHDNPKFMRELTAIEDMVGYQPKELERFYDETKAVAAPRLSAAMERVQEKLVAKMERRGFLDGSAKRDDLWSFGGIDGRAKAAFSKTVNDVFLSAFVRGHTIGRREMDNAGAKFESEAPPLLWALQEDEFGQLIDAKAAQEYWANIRPITSGWTMAGIRKESFWITGLYLDDHGQILNAAKGVVQQGFSSGDWERARRRMREMFREWTSDGAVKPDGMLFTPWHADLVVRNALSRGYMAGKNELFLSDAKVLACYQWSSIIDPRTTDHCEMMDTETFYHGQVEFPPAHHGCRSDVVPILKGVEHKAPDAAFLTRQQALRDPLFTSGVPLH